MDVWKCRACGANLPDPGASARVVCPYCHAVNERQAPGGHPRAPGSTLPVRSAGSAVVLAVVFVTIATVCLGGGVVLVGSLSLSVVAPPVAREVVAAVDGRTRWVPDFPARARLDPFAAVPLVHEKARTWRSDAVFYGVEAAGLRADGTTDVSSAGDPENRVEWHFYSAGAYAERLVATAGDYMLTVRVEPGGDRSHLSDWGAPRDVKDFPAIACGTRALLRDARQLDPDLAGGAVFELTWSDPDRIRIKRTGWRGKGARFDPRACRPD